MDIIMVDLMKVDLIKVHFQHLEKIQNKKEVAAKRQQVFFGVFTFLPWT